MLGADDCLRARGRTFNALEGGYPRAAFSAEELVDLDDRGGRARGAS